MTVLHTIENKHWQIGILPETGASIAFGRIRYNGIWLDILRPTAPANYGNPSKCSSFIMLPWANRIRDGKFTFGGSDYQLQQTSPGVASHGDVRTRIWEIEEAHHNMIRLSFDSSAHVNINFPFAFSAVAEFLVERKDFILILTLKNRDTRPMPAGFGHHPYFVRPDGDNKPQLQVPCFQYFELAADYLPTAAPVPVAPYVDFRELRTLDADTILNDLLTDRQPESPIRIIYPAWQTEIEMIADAIFKHILVYTPEGDASFAVEPQTIANDGFNLMNQNIAGHGVFVLQPGEKQTAVVRLHLKSAKE